MKKINLTIVVTKYLLVAFLMVTITAISVPTHTAHAGGLDGRATLWQQLIQSAEQKLQTIQQTISAGANVTVAGAQVGLMAKENLLDGIGWAIAKQMVSSMTQSLLNWINSGFQGSPAFITDLNGFLLDAIDTAAGQYIKSLGGIGEFICSPFKLDVQAALSINYAAARSGMPSGPTEPSCKLSDIGKNIEDFMNGGMTDWGQWLTITSNPQNTPFGAYLEAEAKLNIKLRNEAGQEIEIASWSDGFLSKRVCEMIEGKNAGKGKNCKITTPGKVISEALTFQLSTGPRTLIEADEINEIIGALINQLTLKAMQGINGLLGLGGNSNYTDNSYGTSGTQSYIDAAAEETNYVNTTSVKAQMDAALATEISFGTLMTTTLTEANRRLPLVQTGITAIDALFAGSPSPASIVGFSVNNTIAEAQAELNRDLAAIQSAWDRCHDRVFTGDTACNTARDAALKPYNDSGVQAKLDAAKSSLATINAMDPSIGIGADLTLVAFATLTAKGLDVKSTLDALIAEIIVLQPDNASNTTKLRSLISRYDSAPTDADITAVATSSRTAEGLRQNIVIEFTNLVQASILTSQATVDMKRVIWRQKLP